MNTTTLVFFFFGDSRIWGYVGLNFARNFKKATPKDFFALCLVCISFIDIDQLCPKFSALGDAFGAAGAISFFAARKVGQFQIPKITAVDHNDIPYIFIYFWSHPHNISTTLSKLCKVQILPDMAWTWVIAVCVVLLSLYTLLLSAMHSWTPKHCRQADRQTGRPAGQQADNQKIRKSKWCVLDKHHQYGCDKDMIAGCDANLKGINIQRQRSSKMKTCSGIAKWPHIADHMTW